MKYFLNPLNRYSTKHLFEYSRSRLIKDAFPHYEIYFAWYLDTAITIKICLIPTSGHEIYHISLELILHKDLLEYR